MRMRTKPPKAEGKSRKKLYIWIMGFMIIAIMIGSALDLWKKEDTAEGAYEYKGLSFAQTDTGWMAYKADNSQVWIMSNPAELANMSIPYVNTGMLKYYTKIYATADPTERVRIPMSQFFRNIPVNAIVVPACPVDIEQCKEMPLKTCENADKNTAVIFFKEANETKVSFENDCLTIQGKELTKIVDKIILEAL